MLRDKLETLHEILFRLCISLKINNWILSNMLNSYIIYSLKRDKCSNSEVLFRNLLDAMKELELSIQVNKVDVGGLLTQNYRIGIGLPQY